MNQNKAKRIYLKLLDAMLSQYDSDRAGVSETSLDYLIELGPEVGIDASVVWDAVECDRYGCRYKDGFTYFDGETVS